MELCAIRGYYPPSPAKALPAGAGDRETIRAPACREERTVSPTISARHVWLSSLEEELLRARQFEAAGKEHLDAQEKRVAHFKAKNIRRPESERLLHLLREADKLHAAHVRLLEREVREASG